MRTLKEIRSLYGSILELKKDDNSVQTPGLQIKSADEKRFADKHVIKKIADRNGNGDDVFNATNVKGVDRQPKHGYNPGEDEKVYEEVDLDEAKRLIPAGPGFDPERADLDALSKEYNVTIREHPSGGVHVTGSKENVNRFHKDTTKYNKITKMEEESTQIDELDDAAGGYPVNKKPNTTPRPKAQVRTTVGKDGKETTHVILPGEKVVEAMDPDKEDLEINEVLKPSMGVKAYIDDFVKSDNPRFKGASKKDRIKRALAAYYSAKRGD